MEHKRNIAAYYLFSFFIGFYIANGTTVLFARELGLSFSRVFTLSAVYMLMFVLFEIPTGALADLIGRKKTIVLGSAALVIAAIASGSAQNFTQLALSFFIWSFGFSLMSGSSEAMLYDTLADETLYHRVFGRGLSLQIIGMALAGILGPMLYTVNFRYPYLASAIPFALAGAAILFFRERDIAPHQFSLKTHWQQVKTGTQMAFQNRYILWSMGVLALAFAVSYTVSNSYQPYLVNIGFRVQQFSIILPLMFLLEAAGGFLSQKISGKLGESLSFFVNLLAVGLSLVILGMFAGKEVFGVLFIYTFFQGVLRPLVSTYANRYIASDHRATVISVQSMFGTISAAALLFIFGFLTDRLGVEKITAIVGMLVLACGAILLALKPKNHAQEDPHHL